MQWSIYALYESVSGKVHSHTGMLEVVPCMIGVTRMPPLTYYHSLSLVSVKYDT